MKKSMFVLAVLLLAAPVMAADWSFYGSQRISSFYVDRDYGDGQVNGRGDDQATQWFFQGNSRFGAKVKADKVTGQIELGFGQGGDGGDTAVTTRLAYGQWQFSDNASLKVGKDYSPVTDGNMSNQVFDSDNDMEGTGHFHGRRPAMIGLNIGNFELAALTPIYGNNVGTTATGINGATGGDPDAYLPKLEAAYNFKFDAGYIRPFAGFQWYQVGFERHWKRQRRSRRICLRPRSQHPMEHRRFLRERPSRLGRELELAQLEIGHQRRRQQPALSEPERR